MPKGISVSIGLNTVDPTHYIGWNGKLVACENDAKEMSGIAKSRGFDSHILLTNDATVENVTNSMLEATKKLDDGDFFLLTYSGHGGALPDENSDESDNIDETWCLYDRQFVDDELNFCLSKFKAGVRIFILSDTCKSHANALGLSAAPFGSKIDIFNSNIDKDGKRYRFVPVMIAARTYRQNRGLYDKILSNKNLSETENKIKSSVIHIFSCQDDQLSQEEELNGVFTSNLIRVWNHGLFVGSYTKFYRAILGHMPPDQTPNYFWSGKYEKTFAKEIPFTI